MAKIYNLTSLAVDTFWQCQYFLPLFLGEGLVQRQYHKRLTSRLEPCQLHGANIYIRLAGDVAHSTDKTGAVTMVAEQEIAAGGYDIRPEVIYPTTCVSPRKPCRQP